MPTFRYTAIDVSGHKRSGRLEAEHREQAATMLLDRDLIPDRIRELPGAAPAANGIGLLDRLRSVKTLDLILFTKQLRTLLRAGVPVVRTLQILESQTENKRLKGVINALAADIERGKSLFEAFQAHPRIFSPLYVAMVRAGESSGDLPEVFNRLIYIVEHEHKVKSDIRAALQYPIIVMTFLFIAFFVLLTFVVPKFINIFINAGVEIPLPTRICIILYQAISSYWPCLLGGLAALLVFLALALRTEAGRYVRDLILINMVLVGPLFIKSAMSRFASIFAILQASGIRVLESMRILSGTIGNAVISREFRRIQESMEQGKGIAGPLKQARYFTPMVINMVAVGEESGRLDEMLREVSVHYDDEVDFAMKRLTDAIGPILTVGLAAVVLFFALAIFVPMWDMVKVQAKF
ncbi:type II secretion system F family protein [Desulfatiglans anilini]|uniref:type II secretion system F family protein n=1 Tax=Desulfatiglans anilini TaxID=90728 RepID=UPI0004231538|nr:type II secretion system F family protein [Desulfatiglans anilini]